DSANQFAGESGSVASDGKGRHAGDIAQVAAKAFDGGFVAEIDAHQDGHAERHAEDGQERSSLLRTKVGDDECVKNCQPGHETVSPAVAPSMIAPSSMRTVRVANPAATLSWVAMMIVAPRCS